jgi:hypothetical protein
MNGKWVEKFWNLLKFRLCGYITIPDELSYP